MRTRSSTSFQARASVAVTFAGSWRGKGTPSATGEFHPEPKGFQTRLKAFPAVALDLHDVIADRTTRAGNPAEFTPDLLKLVGRQASHHGHRLASPSALDAPEADPTVSRCLWNRWSRRRGPALDGLLGRDPASVR